MTTNWDAVPECNEKSTKVSIKVTAHDWDHHAMHPPRNEVMHHRALIAILPCGTTSELITISHEKMINLGIEVRAFANHLCVIHYSRHFAQCIVIRVCYMMCAYQHHTFRKCLRTSVNTMSATKPSVVIRTMLAMPSWRMVTSMSLIFDRFTLSGRCQLWTWREGYCTSFSIRWTPEK